LKILEEILKKVQQVFMNWWTKKSKKKKSWKW
jgi:hypothetical protein